jgi:hypothetical protein
VQRGRLLLQTFRGVGLELLVRDEHAGRSSTVVIGGGREPLSSVLDQNLAQCPPLTTSE